MKQLIMHHSNENILTIIISLGVSFWTAFDTNMHLSADIWVTLAIISAVIIKSVGLGALTFASSKMFNAIYNKIYKNNKNTSENE